MRVRDYVGSLWTTRVSVVALVAYVTAMAFSFFSFTVGGLAFLFASPPMALAYLIVFGSAFVAAVARSRYLPKFSPMQFIVPILFGLVLLLATSCAGIWSAHFLNDRVFHLPVKEFRS